MRIYSIEIACHTNTTKENKKTPLNSLSLSKRENGYLHCLRFHRLALLLKPTVTVSAPVLGLPPMGKRKGGVRCSMETKQGNGTVVGAGVSAAATAALTAVMSNPAMALVDERMSTEGTGLPFGLSNNLLGWILFGVFGLIWTFYFIYTSSLEEDEESGLSL